MPPARTPPHLATLVLLTALSVLTLNMFLPSLPGMTRDLDATAAQMGVAISGYMIASALLQLVMGPLSDRVGRRPVLLASMALYALASLGCLLAQDAVSFLAFRLAQASAVAGTVLSAAVVRDLFPPREAAGRMGAIGAAMGLAPMLGPTLGGVLDSLIGWRAVFGLYTALGAVALALVWVDLGETRRPGLRPLRAADYAALLRAPLFWAFALCQSFTLGAFYIFITGAPFVATHLWDLSPALIGAGIGSITGGFMLGALVTARLAPRLGIHRLILIGRLLPTAGLVLGLAAFLAGFSHPLLLFGFTLSVGFGNGLTLANSVTGALSVRPDLAGTASSLVGALSLAGGAGLAYLTLWALEGRATPELLLGLMLASVLVSLAAGIIAARLDSGPA